MRDAATASARPTNTRRRVVQRSRQSSHTPPKTRHLHAHSADCTADSPVCCPSDFASRLRRSPRLKHPAAADTKNTREAVNPLSGSSQQNGTEAAPDPTSRLRRTRDQSNGAGRCCRARSAQPEPSTQKRSPRASGARVHNHATSETETAQWRALKSH